MKGAMKPEAHNPLTSQQREGTYLRAEGEQIEFIRTVSACLGGESNGAG